MWRWTGSDLQHGWICDMRNLEVEQIYVPRLASPSCPVFQHEPAKKNVKFPRHIFYLLLPTSKIKNRESRYRSRHSHHSHFKEEDEELINQSLCPHSDWKIDRKSIDDRWWEGWGKGREGKGSQQPRERSTYSLNSDLWPLNNNTSSPSSCEPKSKSQARIDGGMKGFIFQNIFF